MYSYLQIRCHCPLGERLSPFSPSSDEWMVCGTKAASRELGSQSAEKLIWEKCRERRIRTIRCETLCVRTFPLFFAFNGLRQNMIFFIFFAVDLPYGEGGGSVLSSYYSFLLTPTQQPNRAMFSRRTHYELKLYCKNGSC